MSTGFFSHDREPARELVSVDVPDAPERDPEHDAAVPAVPEGNPPGAPEPVAKGTFVVYPDGGGGFVLVLGMAGDPEPFKHHIPAAMFKMAKMAGGLNFGPLAGLLGGR